MFYPLSFTEEDGDIVVRSRDFPELLTAGDNAEEARENAEDALDVVVLTYLEKGIDLPEPSEEQAGEVCIYVPATTAAKALVIQAFKEAGITKVELANRMGIAETEARRILDPHYGTKLDKIDDAAKAMGRRIVVELAA
jgi:antitoxin HicB